jgi:hypothetical protein
VVSRRVKKKSELEFASAVSRDVIDALAVIQSGRTVAIGDRVAGEALRSSRREHLVSRASEGSAIARFETDSDARIRKKNPKYQGTAFGVRGGRVGRHGLDCERTYAISLMFRLLIATCRTGTIPDP